VTNKDGNFVSLSGEHCHLSNITELKVKIKEKQLFEKAIKDRAYRPDLAFSLNSVT